MSLCIHDLLNPRPNILHLGKKKYLFIYLFIHLFCFFSYLFICLFTYKHINIRILIYVLKYSRVQKVMWIKLELTTN